MANNNKTLYNDVKSESASKYVKLNNEGALKYVKLDSKSASNYVKYQMDFEEFLYTQNSEEYLSNYIKECYEKSNPMDSVMHEKLKNLHRMYLCVERMPEIVQDFTSN